MKNKYLKLVEEQQISALKTYKQISSDKDGKVTGEQQVARSLEKFQIGDQVEISLLILEGTKQRVQLFSGVVIAMRGEGMREMFTVRRMVQGEGVERTFPLNSPKIAKIEVKRTGRVRRAKLYYLRDRVGKAMRLRERKDNTESAPAAAATAAAPKTKAGG
jgi:large subunit ribosomal protein L19